MRSPTIATPPGTGSRVPRIVAYTAAILGAVAILLFVTRATSGPDLVSRLTVVNPTAYDLDVEAANAAREDWTGVGTASRARTETFQDVVDQGRTWVLRFSYAGHTAGELQMTRQQLSAARWRVEIPAAFADALRASGVSPPPA